MNDKTAELRDIFLDTTGEETVTERQAERRGSLVDVDDPADVDERLRGLVGTMRERYDFATDLGPDAYVRLIRAYYDGDDDDDALAEALDVDAETVRQARLDCHLVRDADRDDDAVRERAVAADRASTRANDRFRDAFAELLTDDDLSDRLATDSREDGLREATEDIETDVSL